MKYVYLIVLSLIAQAGSTAVNDEFAETIRIWRAAAADVEGVRGSVVYENGLVHLDYGIVAGERCRLDIRILGKRDTLDLGTQSSRLFSWDARKYENPKDRNPARLTGILMFPLLPKEVIDAFGEFTTIENHPDGSATLEFKFRYWNSMTYDRCLIHLDKTNGYRIRHIRFYKHGNSFVKIHIVIEDWVKIGEAYLPTRAVQHQGSAGETYTYFTYNRF